MPGRREIGYDHLVELKYFVGRTRLGAGKRAQPRQADGRVRPLDGKSDSGVHNNLAAGPAIAHHLCIYHVGSFVREPVRAFHPHARRLGQGNPHPHTEPVPHPVHHRKLGVVGNLARPLALHQLFLDGNSTRNRVARILKHNHKRVPLRPHLVPVVDTKLVPKHLVVHVHCINHLGRVRLPQIRRALHVRDEDGNLAAGRALLLDRNLGRHVRRPCTSPLDRIQED